jgi:hypothetical protein
MKTLTINDYAICGGTDNATVSTAIGDAWLSYWKHFEKTAEGPAIALPEFAVWKINGKQIKPNAYFLVF